MDYGTEKELKKRLLEGQYFYYVLSASYGLNGWVLGKSYEIIPSK